MNQKSSIRTTGTVKWFSSDKGYGFITLAGGKDVFVHYSQIEAEGRRDLYEGETVEFAVVETERGQQAQSVTRVRPAPPPIPSPKKFV